MSTSAVYNDSKIDVNKFLELVEKVSASQVQEKTLLYASDFQKSALEQYLGIKIESDDLIVNTVVGRIRLVIASDVVARATGSNKIFVIDGVWEG